jgi:tRNA-binding protein
MQVKIAAIRFHLFRFSNLQIMNTITWDDFEKIDIRVGTIIAANEFPKAKKPAYQLTIDFGPDLGIKQSSAQITKFYTVESLQGQQVVAVVNFPPKNIAGFISECLVLGVYDENKNVVLLAPKHSVTKGMKIG